MLKGHCCMFTLLLFDPFLFKTLLPICSQYVFESLWCVHAWVLTSSNAVGHLTSKSDVYSFGVVLLEMLSGRRALDKNRPNGEHNLVEWARPYLSNKRKIYRVLDARLEGQYPLGGAQKAAALAVQCLSTEARHRPTMDEVVAALEQLQDTKDIAKSPQVQQKAANASAQRHGSFARPKVPYPRPSASPLYD